MQINLDPTRWLVSFAGFVVDWVMTREWTKIALNSIPLLFLITVAGLVFWGSRLDKHKLAARYLELGEKEIADWEASWAPDRAAELKKAEAKSDVTPTAADAPKPAEAAAVTDSKSNGSDASGDDKRKLSRFAEVLFRRVQLLEPSERSQFVIAVTMAQRGAVGQARKMLAKIAPDNRPGFPPAHAWIASTMLEQPIDPAAEPILFHHVQEAVKWDRVPEKILLVAGQRMLQRKEINAGIALFKRAAEANPKHHMLLLQLADAFDNKLLREETSKRAEEIYRGALAANPYELDPRLTLIQFLAISGRLDEAEQVVQEGLQQSKAPELTRAHSEIYRLRFLQTLKTEGSTLTSDLQLLDTAMRIDPSNPMVGEEIAKLANFNDASPGDELMQKLQQFLAEGKATAATHAWIAELYLKRQKFDKALPHLEQVVTRLPTAAQYLNNLAYIIVDIAPNRIDEALSMAQRAVQLSPRSADYHDTLARVLVAKNRTTEAITALESAIECDPMRTEFHEDIAKLYEAAGNVPMAEQHRKVIEEIKSRQARAAADAQAKAAAEAEAQKAESPTPDSATPDANETKTSEAAAPESNTEPAAEPTPEAASAVEPPVPQDPERR